MEGFLLVLDLDIEQHVGAEVQGFGKLRRGLGNDDIEIRAVHRAPAVQQAARGEIGIHHVSAGLDQDHRGRRVLHDRIQQQFTLEQILPLLAQHPPQLVVRRDQVTHLVAPRVADGETEITIAECRNAAAHRTDQRRHRTCQVSGQNEGRQRQHEHTRRNRPGRRIKPFKP